MPAWSGKRVSVPEGCPCVDGPIRVLQWDDVKISAEAVFAMRPSSLVGLLGRARIASARIRSVTYAAACRQLRARGRQASTLPVAFTADGQLRNRTSRESPGRRSGLGRDSVELVKGLRRQQRRFDCSVARGSFGKSRVVLDAGRPSALVAGSP